MYSYFNHGIKLLLIIFTHPVISVHKNKQHKTVQIFLMKIWKIVNIKIILIIKEMKRCFFAFITKQYLSVIKIPICWFATEVNCKAFCTYSSTPTWFECWHWAHGRQHIVAQQSPPTPPSMPSLSRIFPRNTIAPIKEHNPAPPQKSKNPIQAGHPSSFIFWATK